MPRSSQDAGEGQDAPRDTSQDLTAADLVAVAVSLGLSLLVWPPSFRTLAGSLFLVLLAEASVSDLRTRTISNDLNASIAALGLGLVVLQALRPELPPFPVEGIGLAERVAGLVACGGVVLLAGARTHGIGGGDVKLVAACGLVVGLRLGLVALLAAFLAAGAYAAVLLARGHERKDTFPLGPFLCVAFAAACAFAPDVLGVLALA